jgi:hypothetical protein
MDITLIERDAVRILFILYYCGEKNFQLAFSEADAHTHSHRMVSETKLQKLDFWLRYPDHLAAALLQQCTSQNELSKRKDEIKEFVRQIFRNKEPILRGIPMRKYLHGAYEPLDDIIAFLSTRTLAFRRVLEKGHATHYFLTQKGSEAVLDLLRECEESHWYAERCQCINSFFGHLNGYEIRKQQYVEEEYRTAPYLKVITRIEPQVQQQFLDLFGEPL